MHTFSKDNKVAVINRTFSGHFVVEGIARVVRIILDLDESYVVEFSDGQRCQRFIDPAAQSDPLAFTDALNASSRSILRLTPMCGGKIETQS